MSAPGKCLRLPFDEALTVINTRASRVDARDYEKSGRTPVVDQSKSRIAGFTSEPVTPVSPGTSGVIVFGDHTCATKFIDFPFVVGADGTKVLRPRRPDRVLAQYVAYLLELSPVSPTGYNRHFSTLRQRAFDLPDVTVQRKVVRLLRDADALIASLQATIEKKGEIKQGLTQALLTGRSRLAGFGGEWRTIRLGDHVTYVRSVPLSRDQLDRTSPLRYLHYGDIHTTSEVRLDAAIEDMPRASALLAGRAGRLAPGDVVFADASEDPAGVGKSVEITSVPVDGVVPGLHTIAARFDKTVLADGFKAYLQSMPTFRESLLRLAAGTKVLATTRNDVSSVELRLPGPGEQRAIAAVLADADHEIAALERRMESARKIKHGMMQELSKGKTLLLSEVKA